MSDPTIERIEAELRESQFKPWDAETFLAGRHQAKIEALTKQEAAPARLWTVAKELGAMVFAYLGFGMALIMLAAWLLLGRPPLHRGLLDHDAAFHEMPIISVAPAPLLSPESQRDHRPPK